MKRSLIFFFIVFVLELLINYKINAQQEIRWIGATTQVLNQKGYECLKSMKIGTKYLFWEARPSMFQNRTNQVANLVNSIKFNNHSNHLVWPYIHSQTVKFFTQAYDKYFNTTIIDTLWLIPLNNSRFLDYYSCDNILTSIYQCYARNQKCGFYLNSTTYDSNIWLNCTYMSNYPLLFQGNQNDFYSFNEWEIYKYARDLSMTNECQLNVGSTSSVSQYKQPQKKSQSQIKKLSTEKTNSNNFETSQKILQLKLQHILITRAYQNIIDETRFKCFNYFNIGTKQIFWRILYYDQNNLVLLNKNIINSKNINHTNSIIYSYDLRNSSYLQQFGYNIDTYFNQTIVDTIWLQPKQISNGSCCEAARSIMYQCIKRNRKCGFYFRKDSYEVLMRNQSCPQLSVFPLFYNTADYNWTPFNGWNSFKYAYTGNYSSICQLGYLYQQIIAGTQNQNYQYIYENFKRIQQSLSNKIESKKNVLKLREEVSSEIINVQ